MDRHWILPRLHHLYSTRDGKFTPLQRQQLERLDRVREEGMLCAEKKCRKLAMGNVDFSPEVDTAKKRRWLWQQVVKKREGKRISSALLKQKARQCGIVSPLSVTLAQAHQRHFLATDTAYDDSKKHAPAYRYEFLCNRAANESGEVPAIAQKAAQ
jgi:alpha-tubulin suppressor-like RCC1 family protein